MNLQNSKSPKLAVLSDGDRYKQWLTSPETLYCCSCMLTGQFRIFITTKVLIDIFKPYQIEEKAQFWQKKRHLLEESNMADKIIQVHKYAYKFTRILPVASTWAAL